jgi:hypothetical protein
MPSAKVSSAELAQTALAADVVAGVFAVDPMPASDEG